MAFESLAAGTAAVWPLWVAPALPVLLASTLESALGFGSAIVLLMFSQVIMLSAHVGLLPELHPMLTSWEHWRLVITVCQAVLLIPCLIAANPRKFACRRTLLGVVPPVLIGTLLGDSLELGGSSGAKFRLALGIVLGSYSVYQLGQILYERCRQRQGLCDSDTEDAVPSVHCVVVAADSSGQIVQSVSLLEGDGIVSNARAFDACSFPDVDDQHLQVNRMTSPSNALRVGRADKPSGATPVDLNDDGRQNSIQLKTITVNSDCNPAEIYLLKPDPSCPAVAVEGPAAGHSTARSVEARCNICSWTHQNRQCGHAELSNKDDGDESDEEPSMQLLTKPKPSTPPRPLPAEVAGGVLPLPDSCSTRTCSDQVSGWAQTLSAGIASGLLGGLVGMWGPPIIILLSNSKLSPTQVRATAFCIGGAGCFIRIFTSIVFSEHFRSSWPVYTPVAAVTLCGAFLGFASHKFLCDRRTLFRGLMLAVMLMCAMCLLISSLFLKT